MRAARLARRSPVVHARAQALDDLPALALTPSEYRYSAIVPLAPAGPSDPDRAHESLDRGPRPRRAGTDPLLASANTRPESRRRAAKPLAIATGKCPTAATPPGPALSCRARNSSRLLPKTSFVLSDSPAPTRHSSSSPRPAKRRHSLLPENWRVLVSNSFG